MARNNKPAAPKAAAAQNETAQDLTAQLAQEDNQEAEDQQERVDQTQEETPSVPPTPAIPKTKANPSTSAELVSVVVCQGRCVGGHAAGQTLSFNETEAKRLIAHGFVKNAPTSV